MEKNKVIGKRVKLIFKDEDKVLVKEGIVEESNSEFVTIKSHSRTEMIPVSRIIRMEFLK